MWYWLRLWLGVGCGAREAIVVLAAFAKCDLRTSLGMTVRWKAGRLTFCALSVGTEDF